MFRQTGIEPVAFGSGGRTLDAQGGVMRGGIMAARTRQYAPETGRRTGNGSRGTRREETTSRVSHAGAANAGA